MDFIDYFKILGVHSNSSDEEIRTAYRKLSKKFHPDMNNGDNFFDERFKEIQTAYEILANKEKREAFQILYNEFYRIESNNAKGNDHSKEKKDTILKSTPSWVFILTGAVIIWYFIFNSAKKSENYTNDNTKWEYVQSTPTSNGSSSELSNIIGQESTFRSTTNDLERNNFVLNTNNEVTYHTFDFNTKTVTEKTKMNGEWIKLTYPMHGFYQESGTAATTYVISVGVLGVKEIWFSPDVPNLGYDYDDGSRIVCYGLTKVK
jgi:curved DNA-binding protein CbpA